MTQIDIIREAFEKGFSPNMLGRCPVEGYYLNVDQEDLWHTWKMAWLAASPVHAELAELQAFKSYVHQRLDDAGIAKHEGVECRIGARLDDMFDRRARLKADNERLEKVLRAIKSNADHVYPMVLGAIHRDELRHISQDIEQVLQQKGGE